VRARTRIAFVASLRRIFARSDIGEIDRTRLFPFRLVSMFACDRSQDLARSLGRLNIDRFTTEGANTPAPFLMHAVAVKISAKSIATGVVSS
jgi:hypothetical protein